MGGLGGEGGTEKELIDCHDLAAKYLGRLAVTFKPGQKIEAGPVECENAITFLTNEGSRRAYRDGMAKDVLLAVSKADGTMVVQSKLGHDRLVVRLSSITAHGIIGRYVGHSQNSPFAPDTLTSCLFITTYCSQFAVHTMEGARSFVYAFQLKKSPAGTKFLGAVARGGLFPAKSTSHSLSSLIPLASPPPVPQFVPASMHDMMTSVIVSIAAPPLYGSLFSIVVQLLLLVVVLEMVTITPSFSILYETLR